MSFISSSALPLSISAGRSTAHSESRWQRSKRSPLNITLPFSLTSNSGHSLWLSYCAVQSNSSLSATGTSKSGSRFSPLEAVKNARSTYTLPL